MTEPEQMDNTRKPNIKPRIEGEPLSGNPEVAPNKISFQEVDGTLDALMLKFTKDENYKEIIDTRRGIVPEADANVEKAKRGNVRGALIPIAATGAGIGAGYLFNSNAYKIGKVVSEFTGVASPVFNTLSVIEKFSPYAIATLGSGISSLTASAIRRSFGENVFEYYSRYSHFDAKGNFVTLPLKKIYNWYARGLEHEAFNTFVLNPAEPSSRVEELMETSTDPEFDKKFYELDDNKVENLVAKGYMHLISTDATEYYGAEFSAEDREKIYGYREAVKSAIDKFKTKVPQERKADFEQNVFNRVVNEEKARYLLATGLNATASAIKAFAFGTVFEVVKDFIWPRFFPELVRQEQTAEVPVQETAKVTVTSPATQPETLGLPKDIPNAIPNAVPKPGFVENPVPTGDILRPGYATPEGIEAGIKGTELPDFNVSIAEGSKVTQNVIPPKEVNEIFIPTGIGTKSVENGPSIIDVVVPEYNAPAEAVGSLTKPIEVPVPEIGIINPNPIVETVPSIEVPEIIGGPSTVTSAVETTLPMVEIIPEVEAAGVSPALESLPAISATGVIEGVNTVESLLTFEEGIQILMVANAENPEAVQQAIEIVKTSPDLGEEALDLFGSLGTAAPEIISGLQSAGPTGLFILNKILQLLACGGSLSTGGGACPALAGP